MANASKGWETRRANAAAARAASAKRSEAAQKGWTTRRARQRDREIYDYESPIFFEEDIYEIDT